MSIRATEQTEALYSKCKVSRVECQHVIRHLRDKSFKAITGRSTHQKQPEDKLFHSLKKKQNKLSCCNKFSVCPVGHKHTQQLKTVFYNRVVSKAICIINELIKYEKSSTTNKHVSMKHDNTAWALHIHSLETNTTSELQQCSTIGAI